MRFLGSKKQLEEAKEKGVSKEKRSWIKDVIISGSVIVLLSYATYNIAIESIIVYKDYQKTKPLEQSEKMENIELLNGTAVVTDELRQVHNKYVEGYKNYLLRFQKASEELNGQSSIRLFIQKKLNEVVLNSLQENEIILKTNNYIKKIENKQGDTKQRIQLGLKNVTSLSSEEIEQVEKNYIIDSVIVNRQYIDSASRQAQYNTKYSLETYKEIVKEIDIQFGDLRGNENLSDLEKCIIVIGRIVENSTYDYEILNLPIEDPRAQKARGIEGALLNKNKSRNRNGIICGGYANLFKEVTMYLGIESKEITGRAGVNLGSNVIMNHDWNQVYIREKKSNKLKWTNVDVNCIDDILDNNKREFYSLRKALLSFPLLVSDKTLNSYGDGALEYTPVIGLAEKCDEDFDREELMEALIGAEKYEINRKADLEKRAMEDTRNRAEITKGITHIGGVIKEKVKSFINKFINKKSDKLMLSEGKFESEKQEDNGSVKTQREQFLEQVKYKGEEDVYTKSTSENHTNSEKNEHKKGQNGDLYKY